MYLFLLKKNKGNKQPFPTSAIVETYIKYYGSQDIIIANPGYLSTSVKTIASFCSKFYVGNNTIVMYPGMNGENRINNTKIIQEHINNFNILSKQKNPSNFSNNKWLRRNIDHSKCAFFINPQNDSEDNRQFELNEDEYANNAQIKAALIGSSNMSDTTYYSTTANKGECDVFLLNDQIFTEADAKVIYNRLAQRYESETIHYVALFKELDSNMNLSLLFKEFVTK